LHRDARPHSSYHEKHVSREPVPRNSAQEARFGYTGRNRADSRFSVLNSLNKLFLRRSLNRYDIVVAASRVSQKRFKSSFGLTDTRLPICGQARVDILYHGCKGNPIRRECTQLPKRVILYAPTWRESGKDPIEFLDLERWNTELSRFGATLLLKLHPLSKRNRMSNNSWSNIRMITDEDIEFTHLLLHTSILISDYSGAILDFALLRRPILLFAPDVEQYTQSRGLYDALQSGFDPNIIYTTEDRLIEAVGRALTSPMNSALPRKRSHTGITISSTVRTAPVLAQQSCHNWTGAGRHCDHDLVTIASA
jgi:CDP-glycerol glycerophosphotransferase (TagB/SpsB family)